MIMLRILPVIYLTLFPALTFAAEKMAAPAFSWLSILNMLFGLAIVVALIYGLSWVLKNTATCPAPIRWI